jgi:hypothetical protein
MRTTTTMMVRVVGVIALMVALVLGSPVAEPAGADPADVHLASGTWSPQYNLGGCLYKMAWGNFGPVALTVVRFYNLSACGGAIVAVQYFDGTGVYDAVSGTVIGTGTDACGAFQEIHAAGPNPSAGLRGLVWVGAGYRWYAGNGTASQSPHSLC